MILKCSRWCSGRCSLDHALHLVRGSSTGRRRGHDDEVVGLHADEEGAMSVQNWEIKLSLADNNVAKWIRRTCGWASEAAEVLTGRYLRERAMDPFPSFWTTSACGSACCSATDLTEERVVPRATCYVVRPQQRLANVIEELERLLLFWGHSVGARHGVPRPCGASGGCGVHGMTSYLVKLLRGGMTLFCFSLVLSSSSSSSSSLLFLGSRDKLDRGGGTRDMKK